MLFTLVFNSEVINNQYVARRKVAISWKMFFKFKVSHMACLGQAVHAYSDLYKNVAVLNFRVKLVFVHDVWRDTLG